MLKKAVIIGIGLFVCLSILSPQTEPNPTSNREYNARYNAGYNAIGDAEAALRMKLDHPIMREVHYLQQANAVCGQVKHTESEIGFIPFAYSHSLGLTVASVWGKNQPEEINKKYGCSFLPLAYVDEWTTPFWGDDRGYIYMHEEIALAP